MARALRRVGDDAAWRRAAGEAGRHRVVTRYSIHERARKIEELIAGLVEEACP
jgi:hypothetical protein